MPSIFWRPWGLLQWILDWVKISKWSLIGCLSTEKRCHAAISVLLSNDALRNTTLFRITNPISRFQSLETSRLDDRYKEIRTLQLNDKFVDIEQHQLFERTDRLVNSTKGFIQRAGPNVIIDISTFPKRFFFPILRIILEEPLVTNLIVTYARAESYSDILAEDPEPWNALPLFVPTLFPEPKVDFLLVSIGFAPLGLPDLFANDNDNLSVKLLLPFPPGPPHFQRNWEFVHALDKNLSPRAAFQPIRIHSWDVSECFNHISSITNKGDSYSILAPYGLKPMSLAMALFAQLSHSPVYYTQPRVYNPDYSVGIRILDGQPEIYAYCVRLDGRNLYEL
jgi:hypothetical protein